MKHSVGLVSLGCAKNLVDSEVMLGLLNQAGYSLTPAAEQAEILIVNTCAFIDQAKDEAIQTILEMGQYKQTGNCKLLLVTGCLAQRYRDELQEQMPEIDAIIGTGQFPQIVQICEQLLNGGAKPGHSWVQAPGYIYDHTTPRLRTTAAHTAYLKIAEGCDHHCTYCIIPKLRGSLRSRPLDSIIAEARALVLQGVKEINLIAQDSTAYGRDGGGKDHLPALLRQLVKTDGLEWIRLLYAHPAHLSDSLLELIGGEEKICSYIDLPLQHIHDTVLKRMGRPLARAKIEELIARARECVPDLTLRTSLMVGFPGETDEQFQTLVDFVRRTRFECLGVFAYSQEEDTPAAALPGQLSDKVKTRRRDYLLEVQQQIVFERNRELIGKRRRVLVEQDTPLDGYSGQGRSMGQAPEVDGVTYLSKGTAAIGQIVNVKIIAADGYDLVGEVIPDGR